MRYQITVPGPGSSPRPAKNPARATFRSVSTTGQRRRATFKHPDPEPVAPSRPLRTVGIVAASVVLVGIGVVNLRRPAASDATPVAAAGLHAAAPAEVEPVAVAALPEPTTGEIAALESGDAEAVAQALRGLSGRAVTPAALHALDAVERRTTDADLLRSTACYRARGADTLDLAFAALPAAPAADPEWHKAGSECLVDVIASRADEVPERALPLLADRALQQGTNAVLDGLALLDPPQLPAVLSAELASPTSVRSRRAALRAAIALGAAAKWPDQVEAWLADDDRTIRLLVHEALGRRRDDASQDLAARTIAENPADQELTRRAADLIGKGTGFDERLATLAGDGDEPSEVRAHAAGLVALHGGEAACRRLTGVTTKDPVLAPQLEAAFRRIDQRFNGRLRPPASR
jgi:hypothetical protein